MYRKHLATSLVFAALTACNRSPKPDASAAASASATPSATPAAPSASTAARPLATAAKPIPAPPDVAEPPPTAEKTASGLVTNVLQPGTGSEHPGPLDTVKVHYTGWTPKDGRMFDSSVTRGRAASFRVNQVIKGWTEALQLMVVGEKRRLWIPPELAYGDTPRRPGAPAGPLTFDVELLDFTKSPAPPKPPADLKHPPKTGKKQPSGLVYEELKPGKGPHPGERDIVVVHYTGWTTDGRMFDSSVPKRQPARFRLNQVVRGWTEGVQLMRAGGKARLWIPSNLAYGDKPTRPGAPSGPLVFEIDLLQVIPSPSPPPVPLPSQKQRAK
jgi:peptidylprolyl isomerase